MLCKIYNNNIFLYVTHHNKHRQITSEIINIHCFPLTTKLLVLIKEHNE